MPDKKSKNKWNDILNCILMLLHSIEYEKLTFKEISKFLDVSIGSISAQSKRINLTRKKIYKIYPPDSIDIDETVGFCKLLNKEVTRTQCFDCFEDNEHKYFFRYIENCKSQNIN